MNYQCEKCGKYIKPDPASFKVGDPVRFTRQQQSARTIRMTATDGVITEANDQVVIIKTKRSGNFTVSRFAITAQGAPSPLTYALCGVCECGGAS